MSLTEQIQRLLYLQFLDATYETHFFKLTKCFPRSYISDSNKSTAAESGKKFFEIISYL